MAYDQVADASAPGINATMISSAAATFQRCRSVYIGKAASYDFSFDGENWASFAGCTAASVLPIQVVGVRVSNTLAAPALGDVTFIY
jgi:hypothetical protein